MGVGTSQRTTDAGTRTNGQFPACSYLAHAGAYQKAPVDHEREGAAMQITRRLTSPRPLVTDPEVPRISLVLLCRALTPWLSEMPGELRAVALLLVRHDHGSGV